MSEILSTYKQLKKIKFGNVLKKAINENKAFIVETHRDQLRRGNDGEGKMREYESLSYSLYKKEKPSYYAPYPTIDLFNTGAFQKKMYFEQKGDKYLINSKDGKRDKLVKLEGAAILQPNKDSIETTREAVNGSLIEMITKAIGW